MAGIVSVSEKGSESGEQGQACGLQEPEGNQKQNEGVLEGTEILPRSPPYNRFRQSKLTRGSRTYVSLNAPHRVHEGPIRVVDLFMRLGY